VQRVRSWSDELSVCVAGLGVMGGYHLRIVESLAGVRLAAVVEPDTQRRERAISQYPTALSFATLEEAFEKSEIDVVCCAAPARHLAELAEQAIEAGAAVLLEKPMAVSVQDARRVVDLAAERRSFLSVGYVERFNPALMACHEKVAGGELGRIFQARSLRLSPFPDRSSSAGVTLDLATHDLDAMNFLLDTRIERAYAEMQQLAHDQAEDLVSATLRFRSGATGALEANWLTPRKIRELTITGEAGALVVDCLSQSLTFNERPVSDVNWGPLELLRGPREGNSIDYALERREPLRREWEVFADALVAGNDPPVSGEDGLQVLMAAEALQLSGRTHRPVEVGDVELQPNS
jgi:UDP-N-acetylglucosamine 3-dehydrogenase